MHILIAGGTGLIGSALVRLLRARNHSVVILTRNPPAGNGQPGVDYAKWSGTRADEVVASVNGTDAVINLAGANIGAEKWTPARKTLIRQSRVDAGQTLCAAIEQAVHKPHTFVQASAVGFYGSSFGPETLTERIPPGTDFLASTCVAWEASSQSVQAMGVRHAIARFGVVLSPAGGALPRMLFPFRLGIGGALGDGKQPFPWIHVDDAARAVQFLIENPDIRGPCNVTGPEAISNTEFSRTLATVLRRPLSMNVPAFALQLMFGEMAVILLKGQNAVPGKLMASGFAFQYSEAIQALHHLLPGPAAQ